MDVVGRFIDGMYDMDTPLLACACGHVHWTRQYNINSIDSVEEVNLATRLEENKTMRADVKKVRTKIRASGSASKAFVTVFKAEHEHFMNGAQIHINALKALQEASRAKLRASAEYISSQKALASANASLGFFKRRYNIGWRESRILFKSAGHRYRRRWRGSSPSQVIRWKFMLRIK